MGLVFFLFFSPPHFSKSKGLGLIIVQGKVDEYDWQLKHLSHEATRLTARLGDGDFFR